MNKRIKNIITVVLIAVLVVGGVVGTRYMQGNEKKTETETQSTLSADNQSDTDETSKDDTKIEVTQEDTKIDETSKDETAKDETSKDETSKGETSKNETSKKEDSKTGPTKIEASNNKDILTCMLTIRCDTILKNKNRCSESKKKYIPEDGYILKKTKVSIMRGETVFDVMKRVCKSKDIRLEYSRTPAYDSYYIEGIQHLYEFDCGYESGWVYLVDGVIPNYGCSDYRLKGGESIVFAYTCEGQGADVGRKNR